MRATRTAQQLRHLGREGGRAHLQPEARALEQQHEQGHQHATASTVNRFEAREQHGVAADPEGR
jgi:hypothetical protein